MYNLLGRFVLWFDNLYISLSLSLLFLNILKVQCDVAPTVTLVFAMKALPFETRAI